MTARPIFCFWIHNLGIFIWIILHTLSYLANMIEEQNYGACIKVVQFVRCFMEIIFMMDDDPCIQNKMPAWSSHISCVLIATQWRGLRVKSVVCNQNSLSSDCQLEDKQWWEHCEGHRDNSTILLMNIRIYRSLALWSSSPSPNPPTCLNLLTKSLKWKRDLKQT